MAGEQHIRHAHPLIDRRTGILRVFQQCIGEALLLRGLVAAQHAGDMARQAVDHHHRGQLAAGEHIIPDGNLLVDQRVNGPLIHALIMPAEKDEVFLLRQLFGALLGQHGPSGREQDAPGRKILHRRAHAVENRLRGHDHARAAAVRIVVTAVMLVERIIPDVDRFYGQNAVVNGAAGDAGAEHRHKHLRKQRQDLNPHRRTPQFRKAQRCPASSRRFPRPRP